MLCLEISFFVNVSHCITLLEIKKKQNFLHIYEFALKNCIAHYKSNSIFQFANKLICIDKLKGAFTKEFSGTDKCSCKLIPIDVHLH
jgi:hypothetical protein